MSAKPVHFNMNPISSSTLPSHQEALVRANTTAVNLSNSANAHRMRGEYRTAVDLINEALLIKLKAYPADSVPVGISYNALGECYLAIGRVDEAEAALEKALVAREKSGPRFDTAVTRESLGQVYEAQGRWEDAKAIRERGVEKGEMCCGYEKCPGLVYKRSELKTCAACKSVFYCDTGCQKKDWTRRHKELCNARTAVEATASSTGAAM